MEVEILVSKDVKLYSLGCEIKYKGTSIIYDDNKITFLFFYLPNIKRVYIVNGKLQNSNLVQVKEKINIICTLDDLYFYRLKKFIEQKGTEFLFDLPTMFYRELSILIKQKNYQKKLNSLYDKYLIEVKYGINYPNY